MTIKMTEKQPSAKTYKIILAATIFLIYLTYLSLCFNNNVWTDEAFTIELVKGTAGEIIEGTAADVHPPLYYLILKPFTVLFGSSLLVMKLVSILPMILTMAAGGAYLFAKYGFKEAELFVLMLAAIPCTMEYAVQVRMYSWAIFFVTAMSLSAWEIFKNGNYKLSVLMGLLGSACAYTHYFAFVAALWIYGFLFLSLVFKKRGSLKHWLAAVIVSLITFLPWYPYMRIQVMGVSGNYWIEPITAKTWAGFMPFLFGMDIPYADIIWGIILIAAIIIIIFRIVKDRNNTSKWVGLLLTALVSVAVLLTGVIFSAVLRPIFIIRYLLPCMGLAALVLAVSLGSIDHKPLFISVVIFGIAALLVDYSVSIYREYTWTHTAATEAFLEEHVGEKDIIAYNYEGYGFVYDYYWDDTKKILWMDIDLENCPYENIWLLDTIYMPWPTDEYLAGFGWAKEYYGNYGIEHNDFKIWRIYRK